MENLCCFISGTSQNLLFDIIPSVMQQHENIEVVDSISGCGVSNSIVQLAVGLLLSEGMINKTYFNEERVVYSARISSETGKPNIDGIKIYYKGNE